VFRRVTVSDRAAALELLSDLRVQVLGGATAAGQRALFNSAVRGDGTTFVVADTGLELVGLAIAVSDPAVFWKRLALRNPLLAARRLAALARRRLRRGNSSAAEPDPPELAALLSPRTEREWGDSSPRTAQIVLVAMRPQFRGAGAGTRMFAALLDELEPQGITRLDARIGRRNIASVHMCRNVGAKVEDRTGTLFASWDLPRSSK
jgi:GNAT superfamily N-acetyltransferase